MLFERDLCDMGRVHVQFVRLTVLACYFLTCKSQENQRCVQAKLYLVGGCKYGPNLEKQI